MRSNNHASPNGILPFVIPAGANISTTRTTIDDPISSGGLKRWADEQGTSPVSSIGDGENDGDERSGLIDARHDAYMSLINSYIRRAWVSLILQFVYISISI